jgi:hypothetical protein
VNPKAGFVPQGLSPDVSAWRFQFSERMQWQLTLITGFRSGLREVRTLEEAVQFGFFNNFFSSFRSSLRFRRIAIKTTMTTNIVAKTFILIPPPYGRCVICSRAQCHLFPSISTARLSLAAAHPTLNLAES